jgi:hypothetical protein
VLLCSLRSDPVVPVGDADDKSKGFVQFLSRCTSCHLNGLEAWSQWAIAVILAVIFKVVNCHFIQTSRTSRLVRFASASWTRRRLLVRGNVLARDVPTVRPLWCAVQVS